MKIVLIGEFHYDWSTKECLAEAFRDEGHDVVCLDDEFIALDEILRHAKNAVIVYFPTHHHNIDGKLWALLERTKSPTIACHFDLYWGLSGRHEHIGVRPFWKMDHVFTPDGANKNKFKARGVNHHFLPPPVAKKFIYKARKKKAHDVCFVGAKNHHEEWPYRAKLIRFLEKTYGERFAHYGEGQPQGPIRGHDLNTLYASTPVIVGDSVRSERYWSDRVPNTLGRGGLLIHPRVKGMIEYFPEDTLLYYDYGDFDYLKHLIDKNIQDPDTDRPKKGMKLVKENYTYNHWVNAMMAVL